MSPDKQRIKIAEICGWKREYVFGNGVDDYIWIHPNGKVYFADSVHVLPDPLNIPRDLFEMEDFLTDSNREDYCGHLSSICERDFKKTGDKKYRNAIFAAPKQRTEAFLLTHGQWENYT